MAKKKTKTLRDELTFPLFIAMAVQLEGLMAIPEFHLTIAEFLEDYENWENGTGVLQIFRGAGKSTLLGLWIVYRLIKDPSLRFLVQSADKETAQKITQHCRSIITNHPFAEHLRGADHTWKEHTFSVVGNKDARTPSVTARGIMSNVTGGRADIVIFDDVEVMKNCMNDKTRTILRLRMSEANHILVPGGRKLLVGTPHAFESIYPEYIESGASSLTLPLIINAEGEFPYMKGKSRWPERFTADIIASRQLESASRGNFLSQYQLMPVQVEDSILDPALCLPYEDEIEYYYVQGKQYAKIGDIPISGVSAFWDPSLSKARGDCSVLGIVFQGANGHYYIHRLVELDGDADEQCEQVKAILIEYQVPLVVIETNGIGGFLPQLLIKHTRGSGIGVDGRGSFKSKGVKIVEAIETPLYAGAIHVHSSVMDTSFITQLRDFHPRNKNAKDDFIDVVASAIDNQPIRIGRGGVMGERAINYWSDHHAGTELKVDFTTI